MSGNPAHHTTEYRREHRSRMTVTCPGCGGSREVRTDYKPYTGLCPKCAHAVAKYNRDKEVWYIHRACAVCGTEYILRKRSVQRQLKKHKTTYGTYCSHPCQGEAMRRDVHPMKPVNIRVFQGGHNIPPGAWIKA